MADLLSNSDIIVAVLGLVVAVIGGAVGSLVTWMTVSGTKWKEEMAVRRASAYTDMARYIELSMGDELEHEKSRPERARIRNAFALFGSPKAVEKFAVFRDAFMKKTPPNVTNSPSEWADVVAAMRNDIGLPRIKPEHVKGTIDLKSV